MHYIKIIIFIIISCSITHAQNNFENFGESAFALNHSVSQKYKVNFALRSRYYLFKQGSILYKQRQIDMFHFSTLKLNYHHDLSLGAYYGSRGIFDEGSNELRFTEQFNYKHQKLSFRYGHRFRAEQRILETRTVFRQRYRFSIDFPLNGEKLNILKAAEKLEIPALIVHGDKDESVPMAEANEIFEHLDGFGNELEIIEGGIHTFGIRHPVEGVTPEFEIVVDLTEVFFDKNLSSI